MIDIILGLILLAGAWGGWRSGAISMLLSVVILVGAAYLASVFASQAGDILKIGPVYSRAVVGFFFLFVLMLIVGSFIRRSIKPKSGLSKNADQILGGLLGLLRSAVLLSFALIILRMVNLPSDAATQHSIFYRPLMSCASSIATMLKPYMPAAVRDAGMSI